MTQPNVISLPPTKVCPKSDCKHAGVPQPLANFGRYDAAPDGVAYHCRSCASAYQAKWKKEHPEKAKEWRRAYVERNKARNRARRAESTSESTSQ